jgi:hypothetical protein
MAISRIRREHEPGACAQAERPALLGLLPQLARDLLGFTCMGHANPTLVRLTVPGT